MSTARIILTITDTADANVMTYLWKMKIQINVKIGDDNMTITVNGEQIFLLNPETELGEIIQDNLGDSVAECYREVILGIRAEHEEESGDDYEEIADGYLQELIYIREELEAILSKKRLDRNALERLSSYIYNVT